MGGAGNNRVANAERTGLDKSRDKGAAARVQLGLDRNAACRLVRVGGQLESSVCREEDSFEEIVNIEALLGGNVDEHRVAAVILGNQTVLGELTGGPCPGKLPRRQSC